MDEYSKMQRQLGCSMEHGLKKDFFENWLQPPPPPPSANLPMFNEEQRSSVPGLVVKKRIAQ
jgi:hypothetical protein